jgi:hypothetical protein
VKLKYQERKDFTRKMEQSIRGNNDVPESLEEK